MTDSEHIFVQIDNSKQLRRDQFSHNGVDIVFENISFSVQVPDDSAQKSKLPCSQKYKQKKILKGISGVFKAGEINAIMGASGAGKTTLLNILACRINSTTGGDGKLYANNFEYKYENFGKFANYVMQRDYLTETLTVRETLDFAAKLQISLSDEERSEKIDSLAKELKLEKCLDTAVGGPLLKGISGGQKKRTSIAFELISDPQVIFLDEPTSGLDSLTSYIIVSYLKKLSRKQNKTVIMTIHQPNSETFELFDNLAVLLEGKIIYQDRASQICPYFQRQFGLECPQFVNPSDFFMSKIHYENSENRERYEDYYKSYDQKMKPSVLRRIEQKSTEDIVFRKNQASFITRLSALVKRMAINLYRNPILFQAQLFQSLFIVLFVGGLFFDVGTVDYTDQSSFDYLTGFLFFLTVSGLFSTLTSASTYFPIEKTIVYKELDSSMYNLVEYFLAKIFVELPEIILIPFVSIPIYYFMADLNSDADVYFIHVLIYCLIAFTGCSLGMLIGSLSQDEKDVGVVVDLVTLPMLVFSGFFKNRDDLPAWIGWIEYTSPIKYGFNAMTLNEVEGRESLVDSLNFDLELWPAILALLGIGIALRVLAFFFVWLFKRKSE